MPPLMCQSTNTTWLKTKTRAAVLLNLDSSHTQEIYKKEIGPRGDLRSPSILLQYEFLFHIVMKGICQMEREGMIPKDASREIEQFSVGGWVRIFDYALGGVSTLDGNCKHFEQYDTSYVAGKLL